MGDTNFYWTGHSGCVLSVDDVPAGWHQSAVDIMNGAFRVYHEARQGCWPDDDKNPIDQLKTLQACAQQHWDPEKDGFGEKFVQSYFSHGIATLEEAFEHLAMGLYPRWQDTATATYDVQPGNAYWKPWRAPGAPPTGAIVGKLTTARFAATFLKAVDERMKDPKLAMKAYYGAAKKLKAIFEKANTTPDQISAAYWGDLSTEMGSAISLAKKAEKVMWWAPRAKKSTGDIIKLLSFIEELEKMLENYNKCIAAGVPPGVAGALQVIKPVSEQLPILGQVYSTAIDTASDIFVDFVSVRDAYFGGINAVVDQSQRGGGYFDPGSTVKE